MLKKDNRYNVLRIFFENPIPKGDGFQLREISRKTDLAPKSVKSYLEEFENEELIIKKKHRIHNYPVYYANRDYEYFKFLKILDTLKIIIESGLLNYLKDKCMPDVIILFGSAALGEDLINSDVDIFMLCKEKKLDLEEYESKLSRKINLFFSEKFSKLSNELKNNIINGIKLYGYLKIF
jgi:predicted nucleotidyltransferase